MTFAYVAVWLGITLSLLLLGLLVGLYLLRPPPRSVVVPSTLLWERVLEEQPRRNRWLRWLLSLLLSALVALSLLWSLTGLERTPAGSRGLFIVIDNSATLAARSTAGGRRLDAAVAYARRRVAETVGELHLADTTGQIGVQRPSRETALALLDDLQPRFAHQPRFPPLPTDLDLDRTDIVLVTDGVADLGDAPVQTEVVSVFEDAVNAGILTLRAARSPGQPEVVEAFLEIANASTVPASPVLRVGPVASPPVLERTLSLAAGEVWSGLLDLGDAGAASQLWVAELELGGDALATDDRAWLWQPTERSTAVTLVGRQLTPLHRALALNQELQLRRATPEEYAAAPPTSGILVFEGWTPQQPPRLPSLLIAPRAAPWLPTFDGPAGPVTLEGSHPLRGLDLVIEDLEIRTLSRFEVDGPAVLLAAEGLPVLFLAQSEGAGSNPPTLVLAFPIEESNLALKESFPVLLGRLLSELDKDDDATWAAGIHELGNARSLRGPSGEVLSLMTSDGSTLADLDSPGLYQLSEGGLAQTRVVEPIGPALTFINRSHLSEIAPQPASSGGRRPQLRTLLLSLALAVGVLEVGTRALGLTE